jgi:S1-C subfamily serine protease
MAPKLAMNFIKIFVIVLFIIPKGVFAQENTPESIPSFENFFVEMSEYTNGTGFLISNNGYIVTCHHVISDAKTINIRGLNGDFTTTVQARVVAKDSQHDLAILKVDCKLTKQVPFRIDWNALEVGQDVFTLGYPLKSELGDEIKLTNGIVSCSSGYLGNHSMYQVTAPIQPGNSGGPLFDKSGNVVGVMIAKYTAAENASYAVKTNYIKELLDTLPEKLVLNEGNALDGKPLTEQVKIARHDVLMIEVKNYNNKTFVSK